MPPKVTEILRGPIPPADVTKQTTEASETMTGKSSNHRKLKEHPVVIETGWCIACFRAALRDWNEAAWEQPLKVKCVWDAVTSRLCQRCYRARAKCEMLYEGIRGHGFELHALLEWASEFWINEESGFGAAEDVGLIHDLDSVRAAAIAVRQLCSAFDCLVKSHARAHALGGKKRGASDNSSYTQYCATARNSMQRPAPLDPRPDGTSYPKSVQFAHRALENLRLDINSNVGLPWYASVLSFRQTIQDLIKDKFDHSDPATVAWYAYMLETFPIVTPDI